MERSFLILLQTRRSKEKASRFRSVLRRKASVGFSFPNRSLRDSGFLHPSIGKEWIKGGTSKDVLRHTEREVWSPGSCLSLSLSLFLSLWDPTEGSPSKERDRERILRDGSTIHGIFTIRTVYGRGDGKRGGGNPSPDPLPPQERSHPRNHDGYWIGGSFAIGRKVSRALRGRISGSTVDDSRLDRRRGSGHDLSRKRCVGACGRRLRRRFVERHARHVHDGATSSTNERTYDEDTSEEAVAEVVSSLSQALASSYVRGGACHVLRSKEHGPSGERTLRYDDSTRHG